MSDPGFKTYLHELRTLVNAALANELAKANWPNSLKSAAEYSLMASGKRLRPVLVLLSNEVCGGRQQDAIAAACAIEMIHTYSLIHDDLPSMDDDDFRRGRPTSHKVFGEALAILVGDCLLTMAFETISAASNSSGIDNVLQISEQIRILAAAAGGAGMVGLAGSAGDGGNRNLADPPDEGKPLGLSDGGAQCGKCSAQGEAG